jgi:YD repeat-containing protein
MKEGQTIGQWLNWDFKTDGDFKIYNKRGNLIYFEDETRYRAKWEYDSQGKVIYIKDSKGYIVDNRPKPSRDKPSRELTLESLPSRELTLESLAEDVLKLSELMTQFVNQVNQSNTIK